MTVTVYTTEEFTKNDEGQLEPNEAEIAKVEDKSDHSEEMSEAGNEYSKFEPNMANSTVNTNINGFLNV